MSIRTTPSDQHANVIQNEDNIHAPAGAHAPSDRRWARRGWPSLDPSSSSFISHLFFLALVQRATAARRWPPSWWCLPFPNARASAASPASVTHLTRVVKSVFLSLVNRLSTYRTVGRSENPRGIDLYPRSFKEIVLGFFLAKFVGAVGVGAIVPYAPWFRRPCTWVVFATAAI